MSDLLAARSLMAMGVGGAVLLPSLWYLCQIFKTIPADQGAGDA